MGPLSAPPTGPADGRVVPRFAGPATFARLPTTDQVERVDVAVLGAPFDGGTSYRPGARFGPQAIRAASRLLRAYHPELDVSPFAARQVADAGDVACNPFRIEDAITAVENAAAELFDRGCRLMTLGGDHTIALPLLRAACARHGPVGLVHFDAHLDTWDTYFDAPFTHGTPFRRASEEGLFSEDHSLHVGVRGPLYSSHDLADDALLGFRVLTTSDVDRHGVSWCVERIREKVSGAALYVSVDVDVMDPAFAPGTGTPEAGGLSSRELLGLLRGLRGLPLVGADVVEVAPAYDHAEVTAIAAAHLAYEMISLMALA